MGLQERGYSDFGYASLGTKIYLIGIMLETYFEFGFRNRSSVGDSLMAHFLVLSFELAIVLRCLLSFCFGLDTTSVGIFHSSSL